MYATIRSHNRIALTAALLFGVAAAMQFIGPELPIARVTGDLSAPEPVKRILRTACYDCHSNETRLPWFDRIAPVYWMVVADVKQGRQGLNFSEFDKLSAAQQKAALFEAVNQIQLRAMPPKYYEAVHPESRVTPQQLALLEGYLRSSGQDAASEQAKQAAANEQYMKLLDPRTSPSKVRPTANGVEFYPEYKNWRPISSTERFDNHTMRVILGNEVAVQAIEHDQINPWPEGTIFAKVAWDQLVDGAGDVRTGQFIQVEFMIKDSSKYASTKGWGWARWRGADLQPYGKTAAFTAECVGCHTPMRDNDFVFTTPINKEASLVGDLPFSPLQWKVISSNISRQDGTMATLYGNDLAVRHARQGLQATYPKGSTLALVTWFQRADSHWFGARIPGLVKSVEIVSVDSDSLRPPAMSYQEFRGTPLRKAASGPSAAESRIAYILGQRASAMP